MKEMQAVILAAGMGKRLKDLTKNNTKCMVKVNGVTLIERMLKQLDRLDLSSIIIVIGYKGKELMDYISSLNTSSVNLSTISIIKKILFLVFARNYLLRKIHY